MNPTGCASAPDHQDDHGVDPSVRRCGTCPGDRVLAVSVQLTGVIRAMSYSIKLTNKVPDAGTHVKRWTFCKCCQRDPTTLTGLIARDSARGSVTKVGSGHRYGGRVAATAARTSAAVTPAPSTAVRCRRRNAVFKSKRRWLWVYLQTVPPACRHHFTRGCCEWSSCCCAAGTSASADSTSPTTLPAPTTLASPSTFIASTYTGLVIGRSSPRSAAATP